MDPDIHQQQGPIETQVGIRLEFAVPGRGLGYMRVPTWKTDPPSRKGQLLGFHSPAGFHVH